jgi:flagellar basal body-associated protein FliL
MALHTEQTPQKDNTTVLIIVVLMFILITPILGAIAKSSKTSSGKEHVDTEQHEEHHGKSESHNAQHGGH